MADGTQSAQAPDAGGKRKRIVRKVKKKKAPADEPAVTTQKYRLTDYDRNYYDYCREILSKNVWYYRDRLSVPRGPCNLPVLRDCWVHGVIDENTLVWGQGLDNWLPIRNVRTLVPQIRTLEVQVATWIKRTFALGPALARIRRLRGPERKFESTQVKDMY